MDDFNPYDEAETEEENNEDLGLEHEEEEFY